MKEWGVPNPVKFQPKNIIEKIYPEEHEKYILAHSSFTNRMKYKVQKYYIQNPFLFIIFLVVGILLFYYIIRIIIRQIKLLRRNKKYEDYHKLDNLKSQNIVKQV